MLLTDRGNPVRKLLKKREPQNGFSMLSNKNFKYLWRNGVFPRISSSVMCCGRHKHQEFLTRFHMNRIESIFQEVDFCDLGEAISLCCFAVIQNYIFDSHAQCLWKTFADVNKNICLA